MNYNEEQLKIIHRLCCNNLISQDEFVTLFVGGVKDTEFTTSYYPYTSHSVTPYMDKGMVPYSSWSSTSTAASTDAALEKNNDLPKSREHLGLQD